jgi:hypothetical protein
MLLRLETAPQPALNPHVDNRTAIASMRAAVLRAGYSLDL